MKKFLSFMLLLLIILGVIGYFLPTNYSVHKTKTISSSTEHIHEYVGDLKKWQEWTAWKGDDPEIEIMLGETTTGIGASQSWIDSHGGGALIFTSWSPENGIEYDLVFDGGKFKSISTIQYKKASNTRTRVHWNLEGDMKIPIIGGYMALYFKYFIGDMFQQGLDQLKVIVENNQ